MEIGIERELMCEELTRCYVMQASIYCHRMYHPNHT